MATNYQDRAKLKRKQEKADPIGSAHSLYCDYRLDADGIFEDAIFGRVGYRDT